MNYVMSHTGYRKIPKIGPSKYKLPKLVTQKKTAVKSSLQI